MSHNQGNESEPKKSISEHFGDVVQKGREMIGNIGGAMQYLGEGGRTFFKNMSEGGQKIANQAYTSLSKIPGGARKITDQAYDSLGNIAEGGQKIAEQGYEGLLKVPGANLLVGKMQIAYNQFWIRAIEEKKANLGNRIDSLQLKSEALEKAKSSIEALIVNFEKKNIPGVASLQLKIKEINQQQNNLLNEKDGIQTRFEARANKAKLYTNKNEMRLLIG